MTVRYMGEEGMDTKRVFLVDDEYLAIEGLMRLVDWERLDAEVCGAAYDGKTALEQIEILCPDVVLTDIRMPGMNGLDLIAAVKRRLPSTLFVVISGYNEFEYARSALRLGVVDYIDKPVTVEKIEEVYGKINQIFQARQRFAEETVKKRSQFSQAIEELMRSPQQVMKQLPCLKEKYGVDLRGLERFLIAVCSPVGVEAGQKIRQLWLEFNPLGDSDLEIFQREKRLILLVTFCKEPDLAFLEQFQAFCESLVLEGAVEAIGYGAVHSGVTALEYALKDGEQALQYAEYLGEPRVDLRELEYHVEPPVQLLGGTNDIVYYFRTGEYDQALQKVEELLALLLNSKLELDLFYSECLKLIHVGMGLCRETGREFDRDGRVFLPHVEIRQYHRAADISSWTASVFQSMVQWMWERRSKEERKVAAAKDYIDAHYNEVLTLPYVASLCGMQPTYFSMMFKEQVGQNYIKYINFVRMEHAKQLLAQGLKVKDIYEKVGFQNYRYFCDKFKSLVGCTPEQYRSRLGIKR